MLLHAFAKSTQGQGAIPSRIFDTPGDHATTQCDRRKGVVAGADLLTAFGQVLGHRSAVAAPVAMAPGDHGTRVFQGGEGQAA